MRTPSVDNDEMDYVNEADFELMATFREWRQRRAREEVVPPYVVLTNYLLGEIVRLRPRSEDELIHIKGMGPGRLLRYGAEILGIVAGISPDATAARDSAAAARGSATAARDSAAAARDSAAAAPTVSAASLEGSPDSARSLAYRVVIEYHLDDDARQRLVAELSPVEGTLTRSLQAALGAGPARVCIRIEADRAA
jgi:ribonuclease D